MDLQKLIGRILPEVSGKPASTTPSSDAHRAPAPKPVSLPKNDTLTLSESKERATSAAKKDEEIARRLAAQLDARQEENFSDILKIVNENSPNVMRSIRLIIANRAGIEASSSGEGAPPEGPSPEKLAAAMKAAAGSPDPSRRVADIATGVGLVPDELKDKFLEAAASMLRMESSYARTSFGYEPLRGADPSIAVDANTGNYEPKNVGQSVEVNFDLFFSLSARSSIKSGSSSDGSFYEASAAVEANFESNFSIQVAGRFLNLADQAEKIDPAVMDSFSKAVAGLAGLDSDALDRFFNASDALFSKLESSLGLSRGELDGVKQEIQATASSFFNSVSETMAGTFPGVNVDQIFELPAGEDANGSTDLLSLLSGVADQRKDPESARGLLESLSAAENARGLRNPMDRHTAGDDLTPWENLLNQSLPLAA